MIIGTLLGTACTHSANAANKQNLDETAIGRFINALVQSHDFERENLERTFDEARYLQSVIDAITRPAERLAWHRYKQIFLTEDRINGGVNYWHQHQTALQRAEEEHGVPAEIIVAIIGIETRYGENKGSHRVIDSLTTLAFHYPKRADFFRSELEQFLLLAREQEVDPLEIKGSYAGAMGVPQFIASSYRNYAIDFDGDDRVDLWDNHVDAIGSVANYFSRHGWMTGQSVIYPVKEVPEDVQSMVQNDPNPAVTYGSLKQSEVKVEGDLEADTRVALLEFEDRGGPVYWVGLRNFYVITRYNHSQLYALAAYLLAQDIRERYKRQTSN